jgi:hypothetical protein
LTENGLTVHIFATPEEAVKAGFGWITGESKCKPATR